jgi:xylulokinase
LLRAIALVDVPVDQDISAARQASELETALGGAEAMASQVGVTTRVSLLAAQMIHLRELNPEAWAQTSHVVLASAFLCSVMIGSLAPFSESEAAITGLYSLQKEQWDDGVLQHVAGANGDVSRVQKMLGNVEKSAARPVGRISSYFEKYGFESGMPNCHICV